MRYTSTGVPVTSFSVAVSRKWTGQDGQQQEKTTWFRVAAWRKQAELANQYLTKGSKVLVIGEIEEPKIFTGQDGSPRTSLELTAQQIRFLSPRGENSGFGDSDVQPADRGYGGSGGYASGGGNGNASGGGSAPSQSDDDIPF
jgi:single-strand DNA-binding protein